ncbi:Golgi-associated plant pathogenesis-related protein 1-like [Drosophila tropicalis]|uniref:Golgi-associated plant pathogenesis-related protein 1-like n=1 Tax=Drosophila tropicalis TaxID=46794 RepID=UPI0035AB800E
MYLPVLISVFAFSMIPGAFANFQEDMLNEHNRLRKLHGSPEMILHPGDSIEGFQFIINHLATEGEFEPYERDGGPSTCKTLEDPLNCAQQWYDEIKDYDFDKPGFSDQTKFFTALVWKNSTELLVATAKSPTSNYNFVIAGYLPKGNIDGQFEENVPRLINGSLSSGKLFQINIGIVLLCSWFISKILA